MEEDFKTTKKLKLILFIITVAAILAVLGASYAYFTANITGNETGDTISIESGKLTINYSNGKNIDINNIVPQNEAIDHKVFTVTGNNNTDIEMLYYIELNVKENTFSSNSLKYTMISENVTSSGQVAPSITTQQNLKKGAAIYSLGNATFGTGQNQTHTYTLYLFFPRSSIVNQNENQGKELKAYITLNTEAPKVGTPLATTIKNDNPLKTTVNFNIIADNNNTSAQEGLFSIEDDLGKSYYFRGTHSSLNNNLIFAGYQWKIIRIDGLGNVRLIYNGLCPNNNCSINNGTSAEASTIINGQSAFNIANNDNAHVGYMFGQIESATYADTHANTNFSTIKDVVDSFYNSLSSDNRAKTVDSQYCIDRAITSGSIHQLLFGGSLTKGTGIAQSRTAYATFYRIYSSKKPSLRCYLKNDRLTLKAGLITADEVALAGGLYNSSNQDYYLRTNANYWTMSPGYYNEGAGVFSVLENGAIGYNSVLDEIGVRPVITLDSGVKVVGTGSILEPYRVV